MLKHLGLVALLCLVPLRAQTTPPSDESLRELLEVTHSRDVLDQMKAQIHALMQSAHDQALADREHSPEAEAVLTRMRDRVTELLQREIDWAVIEPIYIKIYAESLTQEEVDGMIAFYRTPVGQSVIAKLPNLVQRSMASVQARMSPLMQKLQAIEHETTRELEALAAASGE